ncbi:hypothetical protein AXF42_Ash008336 [Apostasia shenzhenica]|uniref:Uncharacterized protein n=1 Tax=Apostasia shenzhenica TaxID=1088818 RepID=A0A2I0AXK5_9ASPA|nr:hypothetical protein AXF42_Ash008336 [Apostasia shenzhenica]
MLCSIPASRASSSWLNRLRASKGFPVPSDLDLEQFLRPSSIPNPTSPPPELDVAGLLSARPPRSRKKHPPLVDPPAPGKRIGDDEELQLFDLMRNALSDLFVMGDPRDLAARRKGLRKQMNPRACVPSASASVDCGASRAALETPPSSADNSVAEAQKGRTKMRKRGTGGQAADSDLSAYSRTEVTVIDTSSSAWKSEKALYRKGMVWKVREKKVGNFCRKKRRLGLGEKIADKKRVRPLADLKGRDLCAKLESQDERCTLIDNGANAKEFVDHCQMPRRPKSWRSPRLPQKSSSPSKSSLPFRLQVIAAKK